jgi:hypothetical protein
MGHLEPQFSRQWRVTNDGPQSRRKPSTTLLVQLASSLIRQTLYSTLHLTSSFIMAVCKASQMLPISPRLIPSVMCYKGKLSRKTTLASFFRGLTVKMRVMASSSKTPLRLLDHAGVAWELEEAAQLP